MSSVQQNPNVSGDMKPAFSTASRFDQINSGHLQRGEFQPQPLLIAATTFFLNYSGLKQVCIGLRADENFEIKIVLSHLKVPSRHVELSVSDFESFFQNFPLFKQAFATPDFGSKTLEFDNFNIIIDQYQNKPTVTIQDKKTGAKFSFQRSVFDSFSWLRENISAAVMTSRVLRDALLKTDFQNLTNINDVRIQQCIAEMKTYGCIL